MEKVKTKEKALASISAKSFISVVIILVVMIAICGLISLFIPQGSFLRDGNGQIIADSFTQGGVKGIALWRVITAPLRVFFVEGGINILMISIFLLIMSGVFNMLDKTNGLKILMTRMLNKFGKNKKIVVCLGILFFMLFGSLFGLFEELVTLLPFVTLFMLSLGFDTMTGLGVCLMASCFGFSAALTNPFSIGIASNIAGISTMSGIWFRLILFVLIYVVVCLFILGHIKRIKKDPAKSLSYLVDKDKKEKIKLNSLEEIENGNKIFRVYTTFFIIQFVVLVLVATIRAISGYAIPILAGTFLIGGIVCGLMVEKDKKQVFALLGKGALAMLPAVLLIALASSVNLVMQESGTLDTIMNYIIGFLETKSSFVCALLIYGLILFLQLFIGSASAKIFLVMPILFPICSVVGISPTLLIMIYCMADGFSDVILPTNPVLLIGLSMSNISYGKWVRWTWKIQLLILLLCFALIFVAIQIGL